MGDGPSAVVLALFDGGCDAPPSEGSAVRLRVSVRGDGSTARGVLAGAPVCPAGSGVGSPSASMSMTSGAHATGSGGAGGVGTLGRPDE